MSTLLVRPLQAGDEPEWRRLWTLYLEFYGSSVPEEVYRSTFTRLLEDDPADFCGLIALTGDRPVGITHYLFHRHCWKIESVCYLQDLFVDADQRGTGVGRALIEAVYSRADTAGSPAVYWLTQESNKAGRQLYDKVAELTPFIKYARPAK